MSGSPARPEDAPVDETTFGPPWRVEGPWHHESGYPRTWTVSNNHRTICECPTEYGANLVAVLLAERSEREQALRGLLEAATDARRELQLHSTLADSTVYNALIDAIHAARAVLAGGVRSADAAWGTPQTEQTTGSQTCTSYPGAGGVRSADAGSAGVER